MCGEITVKIGTRDRVIIRCKINTMKKPRGGFVYIGD